MKIKYSHKIIFFFIIIFSFFIIYYVLGKLSSKMTVIEGNAVTDKNQPVKKGGGSGGSGDSREVIDMKKKIRIMNRYITSKVDPKLKKLLEDIKYVSEKSTESIRKESEEKLSVFSTKNTESKKVVSQKKVPPFSASEINSSF